MEAMKIYKDLSQPPKSALRQITDGNLKGKTDINPQWRYEAMTAKFGLVGIGWKYDIQHLWTEKGAGNEVLAFAQVAVYIRDPDTKEWSDPIIGIGGSKLINDFHRGPASNDEGYKMAVTDAFSTSLKMIGVAADIYAGRWDGSKYKDTPAEEPAGKVPVEKKTAPAHQPIQRKGYAGGPDTKEEHEAINEILGRKYPDGTKVFSNPDCANIEKSRAIRTAAEVIQDLNEEHKHRLEVYWEKAKKQHEEQVAARPENQEAPVEDDPDYYQMTPQEEAGADNAFEIF